ncbi:hypothetical protein ACKKBG_A38320 [Auxenochlorella protothecoides x Auxenochlorella symbiontica]|uniref:FAS1 domain-containing protein n=2 Tax=Auxenochlorella protothecoides TaxID=3075 RepID=A0A087SBC6_AUXPR|nr:hypothetical protein F751_0414 [Auxenochlorella protothecoides]KFM23030.1 hypothetical protein F751_0414 [Auxenochlorella protothecoides]RMZ54178.1 hypothetical protein APUTEX25_005334 [Auxenochlorella protothecoides]|eukprot:RMZ54178.1 hypothetical protein APUTEX25_005334 [Auxenochlorella protothecoides]
MARSASLILAVVGLIAVAHGQYIDTDASTGPQVTYIQQLISGSKLLPEDADIPTATYILPDNDAITKLLSSFGVTFDQAIAALGAGLLPAAIQNRLNSVILYHIIPSGALTPTELGAEGTVPTALPEESLQFSADGAVITTATGTSNVLANGDSAGASYLIVDAALLPADFNTVAETTTEEAKAILAALGSSTPSPTLE